MVTPKVIIVTPKGVILESPQLLIFNSVYIASCVGSTSYVITRAAPIPASTDTSSTKYCC